METTRDDEAQQASKSVAEQDTPWLTAQEAADLLKLDVETIRRHVRTYRRTKGREGLRCSQRTVRAHIRIHYDDLMRWHDGLAPKTGVRRYRAA